MKTLTIIVTMTMSAQSALASFASDTLIQVPGGTRAVYTGRVISIAGDSGDQNNTLLVANGVVAGSYLAEVALLDQRNGRI